VSAAPLIISLSTIPSRFAEVHTTLEALLGQVARIDEIRLNIPRRYRRFPRYDGALPEVPKGIRIVRTEEDFGPATKLLPTLDDLAKEDVQILFCDDDRLYSRRWARRLARTQALRPGEAVSMSGRDLDGDLGLSVPASRPTGPRFRQRNAKEQRFDWYYRLGRLRQQLALRSLTAPPRAERAPRRLIAEAGYADILQGWGGAVVRPAFFDSIVMQVPDNAFHVDDVWISGMLARSGVPIWVPAGLPIAPTTKADTFDGLWNLAASRGDPEDLDRTCARHLRDTYGIWQPEAG